MHTSHTPTSDGSAYYVEFYSASGISDCPLPLRPVDSDGDTIPDYEDPYPLDFNNDGISDQDTDYDADGDGLMDYPYGDDFWLNTTIPDSPIIPEKYREITVKRYIGPKNTKGGRGNGVVGANIKRSLEIYIDLDGYKSTGYRFLSIGAEYRIVVERRGVDMNVELDKWRDGKWVNVDEPGIAISANKVEISSSVPLTSRSKVLYYTFNWLGERDYIFSSIITRAPQEPHVIYGYVYDENGNPLPGAPVTITNTATGDSVTIQTDSNGYYQYDLANLPNGYSGGDEIYVEATNTTSGHTGSNSTLVDTTTPTQQVDVNIVPENITPLAVPVLIALYLGKRKIRSEHKG
jgi:hypothetical protein